jgi:hypothetical protein
MLSKERECSLYLSSGDRGEASCSGCRHLLKTLAYDVLHYWCGHTAIQIQTTPRVSRLRYFCISFKDYGESTVPSSIFDEATEKKAHMETEFIKTIQDHCHTHGSVQNTVPTPKINSRFPFVQVNMQFQKSPNPYETTSSLPDVPSRQDRITLYQLLIMTRR